ncbi:SOSS complex subunit C homolog [Teleopsis dalmanni]|uniref:SOSS complex subunit C homolog n=1 Tax=Teleopsis dalmanni TaxID=139649 RepID=UPI0018CCEE03|nr:SOSS complex subunit C homolog [Teleopsis dalmanni]
MAFPALSAQQETTQRKVLEDVRKQLIHKGVPPVTGLGTGLTPPVSQVPTTQIIGTLPDFGPGTSAATTPRSIFNPNSASTLGFFIPQDSFFGNNFIPVLPRLEPSSPNQTPK